MATSQSCCSSTLLEQPHGLITKQCTPGWHRRPLPDIVIPLNSEKGKRLFREALLSDGLHGYFSLAETFHTQSEPSYCGPGTLSMVLNSLNIDPGHIWKGNWRYFDENTLRTCDKRKPKDNPLENVIQDGVTFEEFLYLAECNGSSIIPFHASSTTLAQFRSAILAACTRRMDDIRLVCSYNRRILKQTGTGHFSPIAAFHKQEDLVLILDVARFKYPSHWVPVELLWQSMLTVDPTTGKSRGFYLACKWPHDTSSQCYPSDHNEPADEVTRSIHNSSSSSEESLSSFIDDNLRLTVDLNASIENIIITLLQSMSPLVVQLATKWSFDVIQKYRLNSLMASDCDQSCYCTNSFDLYPKIIPENINDSTMSENNECKNPCSQVTRSHFHLYAFPTRCVLKSFIELFQKENNHKLYDELERIHVEQHLTINNDYPMYLFGGFSMMIDDEHARIEIERGLATIFLYAIRTEKFLSTIDLFDSNEVSLELKNEINYAKLCFGL